MLEIRMIIKWRKISKNLFYNLVLDIYFALTNFNIEYRIYVHIMYIHIRECEYL